VFYDTLSVTLPEVSSCHSVVANYKATDDEGKDKVGLCSMREEVEVLHNVRRCTTSMQVRKGKACMF